MKKIYKLSEKIGAKRVAEIFVGIIILAIIMSAASVFIFETVKIAATILGYISLVCFVAAFVFLILFYRCPHCHKLLTSGGIFKQIINKDFTCDNCKK